MVETLEKMSREFAIAEVGRLVEDTKPYLARLGEYTAICEDGGCDYVVICESGGCYS